MAKDLTPKTFNAKIGKIKIETDDRVESGTALSVTPNGTVLSQIDVYDFIVALVSKAGLNMVVDEATGSLTVTRPENLLVQARRQELANVYGDREFSQLDTVSKALINHIIETEVAEGKHRPKPPRPNQSTK